MTDIKTNSLLTEHFGYSPISVIDDVINSVNEIMYKCTQAVEDYLTEREQSIVQELENKKKENEDDDVVMEGDEKLEIPSDEIELGTAKLETLLESSVDKNFDLFELYSLRNIFTIPAELVSEGWFRLGHHKEFEDVGTAESEKLDTRLDQLRSEINTQLTLKKILKVQRTKVLQVNKILKIYAKSITFLNQNPNFEKIVPMKENLHFMISQMRSLCEDITKIKGVLLDDDNLIRDFKTRFNASDRDKYIDSKTDRLLQSLELAGTKKE